MSNFFTLLTLVAFIALAVFIRQARKKRPGAARKAWISLGVLAVTGSLIGATMTSAERGAVAAREQAQAREEAATAAATAQEQVRQQADRAAAVQKEEARQAALPKPAADGSKKITGADWAGCADRDVYNRLTELAVQKDLQAYSTFLLSNDCVMFNRGEDVFFEGVGFGVQQVRRRGETQSYWTASEATQ